MIMMRSINFEATLKNTEPFNFDDHYFAQRANLAYQFK